MNFQLTVGTRDRAANSKTGVTYFVTITIYRNMFTPEILNTDDTKTIDSTLQAGEFVYDFEARDNDTRVSSCFLLFITCLNNVIVPHRSTLH